jgi:hypothetical protein
MNTTKPCRYCKEDILKDASVCKHCGKKQTAGFFKRVGQGILILFAIGIISTLFSSGSKTTATPQKEKVEISEAECQTILKDLYLVSSGKKHPQPTDPLYKETTSLLEQKSAAAGLPVSSFTSPNTEYVLPQSSCGQDLNTLIDAIVTGEKNARQ